ncbi:MAG: DUF2076 domain-containing protein [Burkholderiaceae bacterium]
MMTPQETQSLQDFLAQLTQVRGVSKDEQADRMISAAIAQQPDAGYLLVQRSMLQEQALITARAQITQLQSDLRAEREGRRDGGSSTGFLDQTNVWGNSASGRADAAVQRSPGLQRFDSAPAPQYQSLPPQSSQGAPQMAQRPGLFGGGGLGGTGGGGSFLGSMAATAAGVAGGAFLFQGIENLMGHHGAAGSGLMGQNNGGLPVENTTVNNFYGSDSNANEPNDPSNLRDDTANDTLASDDIGNNDDLGSDDDISSI